MNRRMYLAAFGVASISGLTGCNLLSGNSGDGSTTPEPTIVDGPAQFTDFEIESSENATVDAPVSVTVSAFNYGSEAGDISVTLATVAGAETVSKPVELTDVDSGTRGEATVDITFSVGDEFELGVFDTPASTRKTDSSPTEEPKANSKLAVGPDEKPVGKALDLDQLRVTLTDVAYRYGVEYEFEEQVIFQPNTVRGTALPKAGNVFAVLRFEVENTGMETVSFDPEPFSMDGTPVLSDLKGVSMDSATDVNGSPLANTSMKAGQNIQGWILAEVPTKHAKNGTTVGWQRDVHETTPERVWTVDPRKMPSFSLETWDGIGEGTTGSHTHHITVKNTGEATGTFYGSLDYKHDQDEWKSLARLSASLDPDQSKTFDIQDYYLSVGTLDFRLRPFDETDTATITAPKLSFGEKTTILNGEIRVSEVQTHPSYTMTGKWVEDTTYTPDNGDAFLFAYVEFIPESGDVTNMPDDDHFSARINDTTHSESGSLDGPIGSPIEGRFYHSAYNSSRVKAEEPWAGWVSFDIPSGVTASDVTIVL